MHIIYVLEQLQITIQKLKKKTLIWLFQEIKKKDFSKCLNSRNSCHTHNQLQVEMFLINSKYYYFT
jgi:hypothetical protein